MVTELKPRAALSAYIFLAGVAAIILLGLFEGLRPVYEVAPDEFEQLDVTTSIQIIMLTVALLIVLLCQIKPGDVLKAPVFLSGMTGLDRPLRCRLAGGHIRAGQHGHDRRTAGRPRHRLPAHFRGRAIRDGRAYDQSVGDHQVNRADRHRLMIPAQFMIAMWPSLIGVYFLPANGTQLAAVAMDRTGTTKIGNAVFNHSFMPNVIFMWVVAVSSDS